MESLSTLLRRVASNIYYNIVEIMIVSLLFSACMSVIIIMPNKLFKFLYVALMSIPLLVGVIYAINNRLSGGYKIYVKDVVVGFKKYYFKALPISLIFGFLYIVIYSSLWYLKKTKSIMATTGLIFQVYMLVMIVLIIMYTLPIIVKENLGLKESIKQALQLMLDNCGYTLGAFLQMICIFILSALTVVGLPIFFVGTIGMFLVENYDNVKKKYTYK